MEYLMEGSRIKTSLLNRGVSIPEDFWLKTTLSHNILDGRSDGRLKTQDIALKQMRLWREGP